MCDLPCVQQASDLLLCILPLYLHVNKKSDDDDSIDRVIQRFTKELLIVLHQYMH